MPNTPPPLWPGYDDEQRRDLLDLLDRTETSAARDR